MLFSSPSLSLSLPHRIEDSQLSCSVSLSEEERKRKKRKRKKGDSLGSRRNQSKHISKQDELCFSTCYISKNICLCYISLLLSSSIFWLLLKTSTNSCTILQIFFTFLRGTFYSKTQRESDDLEVSWCTAWILKLPMDTVDLSYYTAT